MPAARCARHCAVPASSHPPHGWRIGYGAGERAVPAGDGSEAWRVMDVERGWSKGLDPTAQDGHPDVGEVANEICGLFP